MVFQLFKVFKSKGPGVWDPNIGPKPCTLYKCITVTVLNKVSLNVEFYHKHDPKNRLSIFATVFELFKVFMSKVPGVWDPNIGPEPCTLYECVTVMVIF